jgi:hypothetical protein
MYLTILAIYKTIIIKMTLSFYQCYHILMAAKKGLNVGNIIYGHEQFFLAKIHSSPYAYKKERFGGRTIHL